MLDHATTTSILANHRRARLRKRGFALLLGFNRRQPERNLQITLLSACCATYRTPSQRRGAILLKSTFSATLRRQVISYKESNVRRRFPWSKIALTKHCWPKLGGTVSVRSHFRHQSKSCRAPHSPVRPHYNLDLWIFMYRSIRNANVRTVPRRS